VLGHRGAGLGLAACWHDAFVSAGLVARSSRRRALSAGGAVVSRDENGTDIFSPYSRSNLFRGVLIRLYLSPDI
jgi:hypothetical protein